MDQDLRSKLLRLEQKISKLVPLADQNELCSLVIPWNAELKTFKEVISDKKNKEELKFKKDEKLDWLEDVKKLTDNVQKILDQIEAIGKRSSKKRGLFACFRNPIADTASADTPRIRIKIKDINDQMNIFKTRMYAIGLQVRNKSVPCSGPELCKSEGLPNSGAIYGRDITDESYHVNYSIMPIIGRAGIGKTSLARLEYNGEAVEDIKPEDSEVPGISKAILKSTTSKSCDLKDKNDLAASFLAVLLYTLSGVMNDKANLMGGPECFKGEITGTKFNWSKEICVF